jgi:hypothetical protein
MRFVLRVFVALLSAVGAFFVTMKAFAWLVISATGPNPNVFREEAGAGISMFVGGMVIGAPSAVAAFVTSLVLSSGSRNRAA